MKKYTIKDRLKGFGQTFLFSFIAIVLSDVIGQFFWPDTFDFKPEELPVTLLATTIISVFNASWGNPYMFEKNDIWAWTLWKQWRKKKESAAPAGHEY